MDADREQYSKLLTGLKNVGLVILFVFVIPVVLLWVVLQVLLQVFVVFIVWFRWNLRGKDMLVIYSNSPSWKEYFERGFLPLVADRAPVLNWSERAKWPLFSLETTVFQLFKSGKDYNPMLVRFPAFRLPRRIGFYEAFRDAKHGDPYLLLEIEKRPSSFTGEPIDLTEFHPRKSV